MSVSTDSRLRLLGLLGIIQGLPRGSGESVGNIRCSPEWPADSQSCIRQTRFPSKACFAQPTSQPANQPTTQAASQPTNQPTIQPSPAQSKPTCRQASRQSGKQATKVSNEHLTTKTENKQPTTHTHTHTHTHNNQQTTHNTQPAANS